MPALAPSGYGEVADLCGGNSSQKSAAGTSFCKGHGATCKGVSMERCSTFIERESGGAERGRPCLCPVLFLKIYLHTGRLIVPIIIIIYLLFIHSFLCRLTKEGHAYWKTHRPKLDSILEVVTEVTHTHTHTTISETKAFANPDSAGRNRGGGRGREGAVGSGGFFAERKSDKGGGDGERQRGGERGGDGGGGGEGGDEGEIAQRGRHSKRELLRLRSGNLPWNQKSLVDSASEVPHASLAQHVVE